VPVQPRIPGPLRRCARSVKNVLIGLAPGLDNFFVACGFTAGIAGFAIFCLIFTVDRFGKYPRTGSFSYASWATKQKGMGQLIIFNSIFLVFSLHVSLIYLMSFLSIIPFIRCFKFYDDSGMISLISFVFILFSGFLFSLIFFYYFACALI
jgi:hypothetical protein